MRLLGVASMVLAAAVGAGAATVCEVAIVNTGKGPLDEPSVRGQLKTVTNAVFDANLVSADVRRLLDTGRYEDVGATREQTTNGVRVVFSVRPNRRIAGEIAVAGVTYYDADDIREWLGLRPGDEVSDAIMGGRIQKILDEYRDDYYPDVRVTWSLRDLKPEEGTAEVKLSVEEGDRAWIRSVRFPGATAFSGERLKRDLNMRAWFNPKRYFVKDRFDMADMELGRLAIRERYTDQGYLDVRVGRPEITTNRHGGVSICVPVDQGPCYRVGKVSFHGVERFPEADLRMAAGLAPGAIASSSTIDAGARDVRDFYGRRGYVDTVVQPVLDADSAAGVVNVRFAVRESQQVSIRNIRIRGNSVTRDKVVRRELTVYPGDILNEVEASRSERRLQNLGFFSSVRHYTEGDENERDLVYEVEEGRSGQMMVGAGFSSVDRMMIFLDVTHGNFDIDGPWPYTGAGQKLKLNAQFGWATTRNNISVSFTEPWFMDRRLQLGTELYHTDVDYDDYDMRRYGGAVSLTKGLFGRVRGTVQFRIERESLSDVADTNNYTYVDGPEDTVALDYVDPYGRTDTFPFAREEGRLSSSIRLGLSYDDRDNPFIPRNGSQASAYFQLSGGPLGGDTDIYEAGFKAAYYVSPWFRHVISVQGSYDTVESYGDTDEVPIGNRLFAGGGRTIRGFRYRNVGPKVAPVNGDTIDPGSYRPYGGSSRALGSAEYTIPLFSMLRLAAFYDTGNVWRDSFDLNLSDMAAACGVGLRFDIPGFPMRIDHAWALRKDDGLTREDITVFWIGY